MGAALVFLVRLFWTLFHILALILQMIPDEWRRIRQKVQSYRMPIIAWPSWTGSRVKFFGAGLGAGIIGCIMFGIALKLTLLLAGIFFIGSLFGRFARK